MSMVEKLAHSDVWEADTGHYKTLNHKVRAKTHQHPQVVSVILSQMRKCFFFLLHDAQTASRSASIMCLSVCVTA